MIWLLTRGRRAYVLFLLLSTMFLGFRAARVEVERSNASMTSQDADLAAAYARFRSLFGTDEDLLLAVQAPDLLSPAGIARLDALCSRIEALPGVKRTMSLANAEELRHERWGAEPAAIVPRPAEGPNLSTRIGAALDRNAELTRLLISADRRSAAIHIEIENRRGDDAYVPRIIEALRGIADRYTTGDVRLYLTGMAVQKYEVTRLLNRDQAVMIPIAVAIVVASLYWFFRRPSGVLLPLLVATVTFLDTIGCYSLAGLALNAVTSLLPPVLLVLSIVTSVHVYEAWLELPNSTATSVTRIMTVMRALWTPCFFTSLTTALGLISLTVNDIPAVRQFGAFAALGVVVAFAVSMTLMPVGLSYLARPERSVPDRTLLVTSYRWPATVLRAAARCSTESPRAVLLVAAAVSALAIAFIPSIRNDTNLIAFLKSGSRLRRDTNFVDAHLTGVNSLEFMVWRRDGGQLSTPEDIGVLENVEHIALSKAQVHGVLSILTLLREVERAEKGSPAPKLPTEAKEILYALDLLRADEHTQLLNRLLSTDLTTARLRASVPAMGTREAGRLVAGIVNEARATAGPQYDVTPTGSFYQVIADSNGLVTSQVRSFTVALGVITLALGIHFRSLRLLLAAMIPNIVPILWVGGIMGAAGIPLSSGTSMIASVVIGISVDDTIHFVSRYRREQLRNASDAVEQTTMGIGRALIATSVVLVLGFWVGCFGSFKPTIYFSLLTGITMIAALACDLLVLPAGLMLLDGGGRKRV